MFYFFIKHCRKIEIGLRVLLEGILQWASKRPEGKTPFCIRRDSSQILSIAQPMSVLSVLQRVPKLSVRGLCTFAWVIADFVVFDKNIDFRQKQISRSTRNARKFQADRVEQNNSNVASYEQSGRCGKQKNKKNRWPNKSRSACSTSVEKRKRCCAFNHTSQYYVYAGLVLCLQVAFSHFDESHISLQQSENIQRWRGKLFKNWGNSRTCLNTTPKLNIVFERNLHVGRPFEPSSDSCQCIWGLAWMNRVDVRAASAIQIV